MTIQDILKKLFLPITDNDGDAETLAYAVLDDVLDKLPTTITDENAEQETQIALTQLLMDKFVK